MNSLRTALTLGVGAVACCGREPSPRQPSVSGEATFTQAPSVGDTATIVASNEAAFTQAPSFGDAATIVASNEALEADTLTVQAYTQFARPLHKLHLTPRGPDDFTAYSVNEDPDTFSFVVEGERYVVTHDGAAVRTIGSDLPQEFALPVTDGLYIDVLAFTRAQGDPVFVAQEKDFEGAAGFVVRMDSTTLETKWVSRIPGFNIGVALQDAGRLYVTCVGFVGAVDLSTGRYVWIQKDSETEGYSSFPPPVLVGDTLGFGVDGSHPLRVDKNTGRRIPN